MCKSKEERGVAGIMAIFLAAKSAAWGLAIGILLHFVIGVRDAEVEIKVNLPETAKKENIIG